MRTRDICVALNSIVFVRNGRYIGRYVIITLQGDYSFTIARNHTHQRLSRYSLLLAEASEPMRHLLHRVQPYNAAPPPLEYFNLFPAVHFRDDMHVACVLES